MPASAPQCTQPPAWVPNDSSRGHTASSFRDAAARSLSADAEGCASGPLCLLQGFLPCCFCLLHKWLPCVGRPSEEMALITERARLLFTGTGSRSAAGSLAPVGGGPRCRSFSGAHRAAFRLPRAAPEEAGCNSGGLLGWGSGRQGAAQLGRTADVRPASTHTHPASACWVGSK